MNKRNAIIPLALTAALFPSPAEAGKVECDQTAIISTPADAGAAEALEAALDYAAGNSNTAATFVIDKAVEYFSEANGERSFSHNPDTVVDTSNAIATQFAAEDLGRMCLTIAGGPVAVTPEAITTLTERTDASYVNRIYGQTGQETRTALMNEASEVTYTATTSGGVPESEISSVVITQ